MDRDQLRAFYGAESGMEKLTADLGTLFGTLMLPLGAGGWHCPESSGPSQAPAFPTGRVRNSTYSISYSKDNNGNPWRSSLRSGRAQCVSRNERVGNLYTLTVAARTNTGGEAKLLRTPDGRHPLFQFGIYSDTD